MIILRLLPLIISTLLLAAHVLRFYGIAPTILVLILLLSLFLRNKWVVRFWQTFLTFGVLMWFHTTLNFIQARISFGESWYRLALIMLAVITFTVFSILCLENKKIKTFYHAE